MYRDVLLGQSGKNIPECIRRSPFDGMTGAHTVPPFKVRNRAWLGAIINEERARGTLCNYAHNFSKSFQDSKKYPNHQSEVIERRTPSLSTPVLIKQQQRNTHAHKKQK